MAVPRLSMNDSDLYQRRQHHHPQPPLPPVPTKITDPDDEIGDYAHVEPPQHTVTTTRFSDYSRTAALPPARPRSSASAAARKKTMPLGEAVCKRCELGFEPTEQIVNSAGELWHPDCFVCAQCFQPFPEGIFYEFEGRKYCEHDFQVLFAPCCQQCNEFIIGRVIKAMNGSWHPACFRCNMCGKELADLGFIKHGNQALCHDCNARIRLQGTGRYMCHKCHGVIDGEPLRFRGELYHPYHFNCKACGIELDSRAREVKSRAGYTSVELNELYCLRCHDKMGIPICGACHRPIEERVVTALGKNWHVEHFVCAKCEKPFLGHRHYEKKGQAYCRTDYHMLFGNICFVCNYVVEDEVVRSLNKAWCPHHFACSLCDQPLTRKSKFFEMDMKPVCKKCYEKLPHELRRRLKRLHENEVRRDDL
ncbi:LIM and senescent cell antigen-like-containing domain protein 1 [Amphibalanus amphitrite]|uniref:LIM domain-containing protein n=1 Tax=Amphibalanus amphitrite TaxID=1232801 RepID=A0A6A4VCT2_AMPAM|nr:LIM and senescent cell antigen-like-containing domain protein 1 [Amphibalanus amphitrite]KAF0287421.1 LIM and senescent cell antigen-like-containing domain protein 1 [Amphibalanus amphitrite]